jgi:copper chaperone
MQTETLNTPAISCMHCVGAIKRAVGKLEGVSSVEGDPSTKDVKVAFDPLKVTLEQIKLVMAEEGYPVAG